LRLLKAACLQVGEKVEDVVGGVQDLAQSAKERATNATHVVRHSATTAVDRASQALESDDAKKRWARAGLEGSLWGGPWGHW
jgi:hypothetical protein